MKATWGAEIRWRMQPYWRGNSTSGKFAQEIFSNRENITVQWVLCPKEKCRELEIKLQSQAGGIQNLTCCDRR